MDENRVKMLEKFIKEDPEDPFNLYALALEYTSQNPLQAKTIFAELLKKHPEYTATYYHAAHCFYELGEENLAKETFEAGIEQLKGKDNPKALSELQNAYQNFLFETEG